MREGKEDDSLSVASSMLKGQDKLEQFVTTWTYHLNICIATFGLFNI